MHRSLLGKDTLAQDQFRKNWFTCCYSLITDGDDHAAHPISR